MSRRDVAPLGREEECHPGAPGWGPTYTTILFYLIIRFNNVIQDKKEGTGRRGEPSAGSPSRPMKKIFLDKRVWRDSRDNWVSFESDPKLRVTRQNIYGRCVPCITNLYRQLQEGKDEIELKEAYHCWKVVAVLRDRDECLEVLKEFEETFLGDHYVKGKFGSSQPSISSQVLMFHTEDEGERDRLLEQLRACAQKVDPGSKVFCQRACTNLYYELLGDWKNWEEVTRVKNPEIRPMLIERIRKLLYWEKQT